MSVGHQLKSPHRVTASLGWYNKKKLRFKKPGPRTPRSLKPNQWKPNHQPIKSPCMTWSDLGYPGLPCAALPRYSPHLPFSPQRTGPAGNGLTPTAQLCCKVEGLLQPFIQKNQNPSNSQVNVRQIMANPKSLSHKREPRFCEAPLFNASKPPKTSQGFRRMKRPELHTAQSSGAHVMDCATTAPPCAPEPIKRSSDDPLKKWANPSRLEFRAFVCLVISCVFTSPVSG